MEEYEKEEKEKNKKRGWLKPKKRRIRDM